MGCLFAAACHSPGSAHHAIASEIAESAPAASFEMFLDRLMGAESAGVNDAKNPRSTAFGPFQFIKSTFLEVTRRHFPMEVSGLSDAQVLQRRAERDLSRRAAEAFSRDNIGHLKRHGLEPTFAQLRLAFLLGAADAVRVVQADPQKPVVQILSAPVIKANPFMARMTAGGLLAKSVHDVEQDRTGRLLASGTTLGQAQAPRDEKCNPKLASCRKFSAMSAKRGPSRARRGKK